MKFEIKKAEKFGWKGVKGWNINILKKASVSYIEINANIPERKNNVNDRVYFVLKGKVTFKKGNKVFLLKEKESIYIPKKTIYSYITNGKALIVEVNIPPFSLKGETVLEK